MTSMADADPIALAQRWLDEATAAVAQPEAMALASADATGRPSVRMVLMRGLDREGFRFYSNRDSRKGSELSANPRAALAFHWDALGRQLRAEGAVLELGDEESDAYFAGRPRESQLGAWASDQSRPITSRDALVERFTAATERFADRPVPRPPRWGGYLLVPEAIEFWQHGELRLHERRLFRFTGGGWSEQLLAP
jgi:pyridoxamine 5'-phosphate oxidase